MFKNFNSFCAVEYKESSKVVYTAPITDDFVLDILATIAKNKINDVVIMAKALYGGLDTNRTGYIYSTTAKFWFDNPVRKIYMASIFDGKFFGFEIDDDLNKISNIPIDKFKECSDNFHSIISLALQKTSANNQYREIPTIQDIRNMIEKGENQ